VAGNIEQIKDRARVDAAIAWLEFSVSQPPKHRNHRHEPWKKSAVVRSRSFKQYREAIKDYFLSQNSEQSG
jgi:hypothetical protein